MLLFYDTETTGLPAWDKPTSDPAQPHIVQISARLVDPKTRATAAAIDLTITPTDWESSPEALAVHGITHERATAIGVPIEAALLVFLRLWNRASVRIGHVEKFDARMIEIAMQRADISAEIIADWAAGESDCTALLSKPDVCPRGRERGPKLTEAFTHYFGTGFAGAHSASADVDACRAVYWAAKDGRK